MNRCPYCKAPVNIPRLLTYHHEKRPYHCSRCGKLSQFRKWQEAAVVGVVGGLFGISRALWHGSMVEYYLIAVTAMTAASQGLMATVMRLEPIPGETDEAA